MKKDMFQEQRKELTDFEKGYIIGLSEAGLTRAEISRKTCIDWLTVDNTIKRFQKTGTTSFPKRTGRPLKWFNSDQRRLKREVKKNRKVTLKEITANFSTDTCTSLHVNTVRKYLHKSGLSSCVSIPKPLLSKANIKARLSWCQERTNWQNEFKSIIFSDESKFNLFHSDGRTKVWRETQEKYLPACLRPVIQGGGGSIMVWGCFWYGGLGPLIILDGAVDQTAYVNTLARHFYSWYKYEMESNQIQLTFQQDNAPAHKAEYTQWWLNQTGIKILPWPAKSPDLNPIEHLWDVLKRQIDSRKPPPTSLKDLKEALLKEWENIPVDKYQNLIDSMSRRVKAVIKAKGKNTKY